MIPSHSQPAHRARVLSLRERLRLDVPATGTRAGRASGIHGDHVHASFFRFAVQDRQELSPADIVDGLREHAAREALHVQVFVRDQVEPLDQRLRGLPVEVQPLIANMLVGTGKSLASTPTGVRSALLCRERSLSTSECVVSSLVEPRVGDLLSACKRSEGCETKIDASHAVRTNGTLRRCLSNITGELDEPSLPRVLKKCHFSKRSDCESMMSKSKATELRYLDKTARSCLWTEDDVAATSWKSERAVAVTRTKSWKARDLSRLATTEEGLVRTGESPEGILLDRNRYRKEFHLLPKICQLPALLSEANGSALSPPSFTSLMQGRVVDLATLTQPALEFGALACAKPHRKLKRSSQDNDHTRSQERN